jgi:NodT family efflux transporter outer membrane factor (OMF) lipoprotein
MIFSSMTISSRKNMRKAFGAVLLLVLSGCTAVGPEYQPPQPEMEAAWHETAANIASAADSSGGQWWSLFQDPLLDSLVARATAANHDLRKAEARIREARAGRIIAAATGSVGGSAASTHSRRSENASSSGGNQDLFQVGFDARWELDIFGGVRRAVEAADASLAASHEELRDVLVSLQAEVARNYLELRGSQKRLAATRNNIATQEKTVALVRGRFEMGLGNELDLVQAETQLFLTKAQVPALQASIGASMHQLAFLVGQNPASLIGELSEEQFIAMAPAPIPVNLPSDLLRQRPDIRAAERRLAAATAEIGVATADLFPKFSLPALLGLQSSSLSDLVTGGSRYWSVGPVITLSLFDQGKVRAGIDMSEARRDAALAEYEQTVLSAITEVENGLVAFAKEQETRRILGEAVGSGEKAVTMANGLFETGLADFLNVLQAERALYQSEDQLALSEQRLHLALVAIFKALGGGWMSGGSMSATPVIDPAKDPAKTLKNNHQP